MNLTKTTQSPLIATILASATVPLSAQITWDGGGANNLWSTPENWSDDTIPTAGNDYVVDAATARSPNSTSFPFDGDSLTVQNGATVLLYKTSGTGTFSAPLAVKDSTLQVDGNAYTTTYRLSQPVAFSGTCTVDFTLNPGYTGNLYFDGGLTGSGTLAINRDASGTGRNVYFNGDTSGYSGDITLASSAAETFTAHFNDTNGWGSGTLTLGGYSTANVVATVTSTGAGLILNTATSFVELPTGTTSIGSVTQNDGEIRLDLEGGIPAVEQLSLAGDFVANGGKIVVDVIDAPDLDTPYTLVAYGGNLATNPTVEIVNTVNGVFTTAVDYGTGSNSAITVTFSEPVDPPADLVWTAATNDVWDVETTSNWSDGGSPSTYSEFDNVRFDDTVGTAEPDVLLDVPVSPSDIVIDTDTSEYLITGTGGITGAGLLTKDGASLTIIATDNAYDGGTDIYEGTLQVGNGGTTGSLGSASVINDAMLAFNRSDTFIFPNEITSFGSVTQMGSGTLVLSGASTYTGATTVSGGTLQLGDGTSNTQNFIADSSSLTVMGGTTLDLPRLHAGGNQNVALTLPPLTLEDSATLRFRAQAGSNTWNVGTGIAINGAVDIQNEDGTYSQNLNFAGELSGTGSITLDSDTGTSTRFANFNSADSPYTGDWTVRRTLGGTPETALNANAANALGTGTVTVEANARLQCSAANGLDSLAQVVLSAESATLLANADTTVASLGGTAGTLNANAGILTLSSIGIPDGADVRITTGATLNLDFVGTDTVRDFSIDDVAQALGTWGATGSGADHETALITGTGLLNVGGSDPFIGWIDSFFPGETDPAIVGKGADPDGDGDTNEAEFATNGNPDSGVASGKVVGLVQDVGGEDALTLTLPVRTGAAFSGATEQVAEIDGLTYRIQGSDELADWTSMAISEVTPALATGLPALDAGWEYRTFRTPDAISTDPEDFIRVDFTPTAP